MSATAEPGLLLRAASWLVAFDPATGGHRYRRDVDLLVEGGRIRHLGEPWKGQAPARVIDGRGLLVLPGLVDLHCHSADELLAKGLFEDVGTPALHGNQLYTYGQLLEDDPETLVPCTTASLGELLLSGCTSVVDIASPYPGWLEAVAAVGLRAWLAPSYRQARWRAAGWHRLDYAWDEPAGWRGLEAALALVEAARADPSGRLDGLLAPAQADTCTADLLRASLETARARCLRVTLHAAQTMSEVEEMVRRHGLSTVAWLEREGLLGPELILGHAIYLDHHPLTRFRTADDLARLAAHGVSVAHCPVTFARTGMALASLGRYRRAGVRVGIGTDTWPFDMLAETREAILVARIAAGDVHEVSTAEAFHAATIAGADALGRPDLGRLAPGAAADLVLVDLAHPAMRPMHDPLRSLLHGAGRAAVRDVFVAGRQVVRDGRLLTVDLAAAAAAVEAAQARAIARVPRRDRLGRPLAAIAPRSLPDGEPA